MDKKQINRTRKHRIEVHFNDEEYAVIRYKIKQGKVKSLSEYLRTMAVYGKVIRLDYPELKSVFTELSRIGINLNQVAKIANETNVLFKADILQLQKEFEELNDIYSSIFSQILKTYKAIENSSFEEILKIMEKKI